MGNMPHLDLIRRTMNAHGLNDWVIVYSSGRKEAGLCSHFNRALTFSRPLFKVWAEEKVMDTILHEIAHALTPGAGHGPVWVAKAKEIGCNGEEFFVAAPEDYRYVGECPNGHKYYRNFQKNPRQSCVRCGGKVFNETFIITWRLAA